MPQSITVNRGYDLPGAEIGDNRLSDISAIKSAIIEIDSDINILNSLGQGGSSEIIAPVNITPAANAIDVKSKIFTSGTFYGNYSSAHVATQWQVSSTSDFTGALIYASEDSSNLTSIAILQITANTTYWWRCRYKNSRGAYSNWSEATLFTTATAFDNVIDTPTPTPSTFGAAFEGGFYSGLIWNEVVQTSTGTSISTGSKSFTVPNMATTPICYIGQSLEIRSRANSANKMIGTVVSAIGTTLMIDVTSVNGSGTFSDWSIMAKYRVVISPKASGENSALTISNSNAALPVACITLTEGWKSTLAMFNAGNSTTYPAAHWVRSLTISGKTDWYIPARDELELIYRNLKLSTQANSVGARGSVSAAYLTAYLANGSNAFTTNEEGKNDNSYPLGAAYTASIPGQVAANLGFRSAEINASTVAYQLSSSEGNATSIWIQNANNGGQSLFTKITTNVAIRAIRRSII